MGDLTITIIEAQNIIPADTNGKSDPFVTIEVIEDPLQKKQKTKVHHKTLNPIWNQTFKFRAPTPNSSLFLKVWDHDYLKRNDPLGNVQVAVNRLIPNRPNNIWLDLQGVPTGRIHLDITFTPFAQPNSYPKPPAQQQQQPGGYIPQPGPFLPQQQTGYSQQYPPPQQAQPYNPQNYGQQYPLPPQQTGYPQQAAYPPQQATYPPPSQSGPPLPPRGVASVYDPTAPSEPDMEASQSRSIVGGPSLVKITSQGQNISQTNVTGNSFVPPPAQASFPPNLPPPVGYPVRPAADIYMPMQAGGPVGSLSQGMQNLSVGGSSGLIAGPSIAKFFVDVKKRAFRDYILIMDMSGSMSGSRWEMAKDATMKIAPFACQADPDGITLYLFNSSYKRFPNLTSGAQVQSIFQRERPSNTTDLTGVLHAAFQEHFSGNKPSTILVITDGEPNSHHTVKKEIVKASQLLNSDNDLSISFIQIGNDAAATKFLRSLDDDLKSHGAKFDIVDTVLASALGSMTFDELIQRSICD